MLAAGEIARVKPVRLWSEKWKLKLETTELWAKDLLQCVKNMKKDTDAQGCRKKLSCHVKQTQGVMDLHHLIIFAGCAGG